MNKLLFIGSDPRIEAVLSAAAAICNTIILQVKTCAQARRVLKWRATYDFAVIELHPCMSRLLLLTEVNERFRNMPVLTIMRSINNCDKALAEAYGASVTFTTASVNPQQLLSRLVSIMLVLQGGRSNRQRKQQKVKTYENIRRLLSFRTAKFNQPVTDGTWNCADVESVADICKPFKEGDI